MMNHGPLHRAQISILSMLRHTPSARFSDLLQPTNMTSDIFKFHVRKLVSLGYIQKDAQGWYELTVAGKEFANNLNEPEQSLQKQPKLSVLIHVPQPGIGDEPRYLFQQRQRQPYFGYWGNIGGPIGWGETPEAAAARELTKQTGLTASFVVRMFYRKRDYDADSHDLLEDKLFTILEAQKVEGNLTNQWQNGTNAWLTQAEYTGQDRYFSAGSRLVDWLAAGTGYVAEDARYATTDY